MTGLHELLRTVGSYKTNDSPRFLRTTFEDNFLHGCGAIAQHKRAQSFVYKGLCNSKASEINHNFLPFSHCLLDLQPYGKCRRTHANHGTQNILLQCNFCVFMVGFSGWEELTN